MCLRELENTDIIIFGTGIVANRILSLMYSDSSYNIKGVTNSYVREETLFGEEYNNLYIKSIEHWVEELPYATLLVATSEKYHEEIKNYCKDKCANMNIVVLTRDLLREIWTNYTKNYIRNKENIIYNDDFFVSDEYKFLNPRKIIPKSENAFLAELRDLILPYCESTKSIIVLEGPYELGEVKLEAKDIVIDCGANMGIFSVFASKKDCTCYAFEPMLELHSFIKKNADLNGVNINIVNAAVSDCNGSTEFYLAEEIGGHSLFDKVGNNKIIVNLTTIDDFVEKQQLERVDFIKADIEGAERQMLAGAKNTLKKFAPKLSLCTYHLPDDKEVLTEIIKSANPNYVIEYKWQKLFAHVPKDIK